MIDNEPLSIKKIGELYGVNGDTLRKQYKETFSDYSTWDQIKHARDYILIEDNIGENLSLDETCLSNGDVYTILTNKAAKGQRGAIVCMVRGVSSSYVTKIFKLISEEKRMMVRNITMDLSSAMMKTAKESFPRASIISDRFHVQKLINECVDMLRIKHRWQVLENENNLIKAYKKACAIAKAEGRPMPKFDIRQTACGETMPQVMARSKHLITTHYTKWSEQQRARAAVLFDAFPILYKAYLLALELTDIYNRHYSKSIALAELSAWYEKVKSLHCNEFDRVLRTFENHRDTILNYFDERLTNAGAESFNAKIKAFRSQFRGVGDIRFFMYRLCRLYS